jgi:hypothetical protein
LFAALMQAQPSGSMMMLARMNTMKMAYTLGALLMKIEGPGFSPLR